MTDDQTIIDAVDLAERLLEAVTGAEHDWPEIEHLADALAGLAARRPEQLPIIGAGFDLPE
jgi:hypothetical protein